MVKLRLPKVDAPTVPGQIKQIYSYLYQLAEELQVTIEQLEVQLEACQRENKALKERLEQTERI